jgi:membrane peptidoglycan carboxypeptidase
VRKADLFLLLKSRHKDQDARTKKGIKVLTSGAKFALAVLALALLALLFIAGSTYARFAVNLPSIEVLPILLDPVNGELLQPTRLADRTGTVTYATLANPGIDRVFLSVNPDDPNHFSPQLVRAVVAKLDPTFWENPGYSLKELQNPKPQTIAERLASELLLWNEPDSPTRSVRMRILASQIVKKYGRTQILEWYLNSAYFGHLAFGAESAAQLYLQKSARDLSLGEAGLLTVLLDSPALNPIDAPGAILEDQRLFLADMAQAGVITTADFSAAVREKLNTRDSIPDPDSAIPGFTRQVILQLDEVMGQHRLERGGLVAHTTLDASLQEQFTCAAQVQLMIYENPTGSGVAYEAPSCDAALLLPTLIYTGLDGQGLTASGLIADPKTGQVLAYLSPTDYTGAALPDPVYQSGTLVSPFVALASFTGGLSPSSYKWDVPATDALQVSVLNPDGLYHGPVSLRSAVVNDYLSPIAQVANQMGVSRVDQITSALGLSLPSTISPVDLFSSKVTANVLQIGSAYDTLANSGVSAGVRSNDGTVQLNLVLRVVSATNRLELDRSVPETTSVLSEQLAYLINDVLSDPTTRRAGYGYPNPFETGQVVAVKVGQTADKSQTWTVGYTPERLVITWMGIREPGSVKLQPQVPAGLWNAMMKTASLGLSDTVWTKPSGITSLEVCVPSGMLPSMDCPSTRMELFLSGNEPVVADSLYEKIQVNRETGLRATVFTSPELIEEKMVINVPPDLRAWAIDNGYPVAPSGYDSIPYITANPDLQILTPQLFSTVGGKVTITGTASGASFGYYTLQYGKGINPGAWLQMGDAVTTPVTNGTLAEWDTTGLNGLYALRLSVVNARNEISQTVSQVTVDNIPPLITLTVPAPDQVLQSVNRKVTLSASVEDSATVAKVEWWIDGSLAGSQSAAPFAVQVNYSTGKHTVQVKAWDSAGNLSLSPTIEFSMLP